VLYLFETTTTLNGGMDENIDFYEEDFDLKMTFFALRI